MLLCAGKNDAVVKCSQPENIIHIVASKYQLYLPNEQQLIEEVKKEMENMEQAGLEESNKGKVTTSNTNLQIPHNS